MEDRMKNDNRNETMGFRITKQELKNIRKFVAERGWKLGAFIRVAIKESMEKVVKEESFIDEASGD